MVGGVKSVGGVNVSEKLANGLPETETGRGGPKAVGGVRLRITISRNIRKTKGFAYSFPRIRWEVPQKQKPVGGVENR